MPRRTPAWAHRSGYENRTVIGGGMINRRGFLRLVAGAASAGLLAACDSEGEGLKGYQEVDSASSRGRLRARPDPPPSDAGRERVFVLWDSAPRETVSSTSRRATELA